MPLTPLEKNHAFASVIAAATGYRLERPGESMIGVNEAGRRALLRWVKDARESIEIPRAQARSLNEVLIAIGDPTGVLYEIFRIKKADLDKLRKPGSRAAMLSLPLRDAAGALEMVAPLQVTARQLEQVEVRSR